MPCFSRLTRAKAISKVGGEMRISKSPQAIHRVGAIHVGSRHLGDGHANERACQDMGSNFGGSNFGAVTSSRSSVGAGRYEVCDEEGR